MQLLTGTQHVNLHVRYERRSCTWINLLLLEANLQVLQSFTYSFSIGFIFLRFFTDDNLERLAAQNLYHAAVLNTLALALQAPAVALLQHNACTGQNFCRLHFVRIENLFLTVAENSHLTAHVKAQQERHHHNQNYGR